MRDLTIAEIENVNGGIMFFIWEVGSRIVEYSITSANGGAGFESGDANIPANVYGA